MPYRQAQWCTSDTSHVCTHYTCASIIAIICTDYSNRTFEVPQLEEAVPEHHVGTKPIAYSSPDRGPDS